MVGVLLALAAPASGVAPATVVGKVVSSPCQDSGELVETAYAQGGSSYRVDRTVMSTKSTKVVPKATVTAVTCRRP